MNEESIRAIIRQVLEKELSGESGRAVPETAGKTQPGAQICLGGAVPLEVSARHVHLTSQAVEQLFGPGAKLTKKRELSQPGEFLSEQRVKLLTKKGVIENVAVLGPERKAIQVELSLTDCRALDIAAPVNLSGDLTGAGDVMIAGDAGCMLAKGSVIAAKAHVHMTPKDAKEFSVSDGDRVRIRIMSGRPLTLEDVIVRVKESFALACHIDFDEANAAWATCATPAQILGPGGSCSASSTTPPAENAARDSKLKESPVFDGKLVTEAMAVSVREQGGEVRIRKGTLVTPAAKDIFSNAHMKIINF